MTHQLKCILGLINNHFALGYIYICHKKCIPVSTRRYSQIFNNLNQHFNSQIFKQMKKLFCVKYFTNIYRTVKLKHHIQTQTPNTKDLRYMGVRGGI